MCGIAGVVGPEPAEDLPGCLERMLGAIAHRGPDGSGTWTTPDGRVGIGHQRLAIIDLTTGDQPLGNEDGAIQVTFNGCIYNYRDLARTLREKGHVFRTHSDTEVIVHAYEEWGPECVSRFNGMWAFALWDARTGQLFCSRDRIGIKPFYWTRSGDRFVFASEIKSILASGLTRARVDDDGLRQYLTFQFCLGRQTLFEGVERLEPGHNLLLRPGEAPRISRYWDVPFDVDTEHEEAYFADRLRLLLEEAVRLRLVSDVPLGAHLSGGLDSSTVVCLSRLLLADSRLKTFTGAFREGEDYDETRYARRVAEEAETEPFVAYLTAEQFRESIEDIIWYMDEPAAGPGVFPQYQVSRLASEHVKVVLGGQGGDEIFIGYARYLVAYFEECIRGAIYRTADQGDYVATLETIIPNLGTLEAYVPMLRRFWRSGLFDEPARRYFALVDRSGDSADILLPDAPRDDSTTYEEFREIFDRPGPVSNINRIGYFDIQTHLQALMHVEDRTSMAWGLESRVPLLDYRLIEAQMAVPPVIKFRSGQLKYLYRRAVENIVPGEILARTDKMGFPVPLNQWMRESLRPWVTDVLLDSRTRDRGLFDVERLEKTLDADGTFGRATWGALCLELWHRRFIDGGEG